MSTQQNDSSKTEELKKELFSLADKRKKLEDQIVLNRVVLENNKVGMDDRLVDKDDFPRNDIDVFAVRHARSNIRSLEYDIKELVSTMQVKLEELHSMTKPSES